MQLTAALPPAAKPDFSSEFYLIFTFVMAMSLFLIIMNEMKFPEIPGSVWTLLGISGGSYLISKGIQSKSEEEDKRIDLEILKQKGEGVKEGKKSG